MLSRFGKFLNWWKSRASGKITFIKSISNFVIHVCSFDTVSLKAGVLNSTHIAVNAIPFATPSAMIAAPLTAFTGDSSVLQCFGSHPRIGKSAITPQNWSCAKFCPNWSLKLLFLEDNFQLWKHYFQTFFDSGRKGGTSVRVRGVMTNIVESITYLWFFTFWDCLTFPSVKL